MEKEERGEEDHVGREKEEVGRKEEEESRRADQNWSGTVHLRSKPLYRWCWGRWWLWGSLRRSRRRISEKVNDRGRGWRGRSWNGREEIGRGRCRRNGSSCRVMISSKYIVRKVEILNIIPQPECSVHRNKVYWLASCQSPYSDEYLLPE